MLEENQNNKDNSNDFFDRPQTIKWILRIFYSICVLLVIVDFIVHRHIETAIEKVPAFYAIYGFVACVILVLIATEMRKVLMRDEHYYDDVQEDQTEDKDGDER
jgi:hypothetical protein